MEGKAPKRYMGSSEGSPWGIEGVLKAPKDVGALWGGFLKNAGAQKGRL